MSLRYFHQPIYIAPFLIVNQGNKSEPPFIQNTHTHPNPWFKRGFRDTYLGPWNGVALTLGGSDWLFCLWFTKPPFLFLPQRHDWPWGQSLPDPGWQGANINPSHKPCWDETMMRTGPHFCSVIAMLIADHQKLWFWQVNTIPLDSFWNIKICIVSYMSRLRSHSHF